MEHEQSTEHTSMHCDICIIDSVPVMEASEFMKLLPKYKK